jgi:hypothetical protein
VDFVDGGPVPFFDTCAPCDVDGTEEVNIKFEDDLGIINGMTEAI